MAQKQFNIVANVQLRAGNATKVAKEIKARLQNIKAVVDISVSKGANSSLATTDKRLTSISKSLSLVNTQSVAASSSMSRFSNAAKTTSATVRTVNTPAASLAKNMGTVSRQTTAAAKGVKNFGEQAGLAARRFIAFSVAAGALIKLTQAIRTGVTEAINFERELIKVSQVTQRSVDNLRVLTNSITNLSTSLGASSTDLVKVSRILSQTGLNARDTTVALNVLAKTTLSATFDDIEKTAEGATAVLAQFGGGVDDLERKFDAINSVAGKFAVESGDLIVAVRRAGGAFAAAGGQVEELIALFTSVRSTTRESAETIATGFRTIFTRIQRPRTISFLKEMGVELQNAEGQFVGPLEAIKRLNNALKGLESTDPRFSQVIEELGGFRQVSKVIPLIQQFGKTTQALAVIQQSQGSLAEDQAKALQGVGQQAKIVKEEFLAMVRSMSETATFQGTIKAMLGIASAMVKVTGALKDVLPLLATVGAAKILPGLATVGSSFLRTAVGGGAAGGAVTGGASSSSQNQALNNNTQAINRNSQAQRASASRRSSGGFGGRAKAAGQGFLNASRGGALNGGVLTGALLLQLTSGLAGFNKETQKFVNRIAQFGITFALINGAMNGLHSALTTTTAASNQAAQADNSQAAASRNAASANNTEASASRQAAVADVSQSAVTPRSASAVNAALGMGGGPVGGNTGVADLRRVIVAQRQRQTRLGTPSVSPSRGGGGLAAATAGQSFSSLHGLSNQQQKNAQAATLATNKMTGFALGLSVVTSAMITLGSSIEAAGREALTEATSRKEASDAIKKVQRGGALKSAGIGAAAGGITGLAIGATAGGAGGPVGIAVGAVIGALGGLSVAAFQADAQLIKMNAQFRNQQFTKASEELEKNVTKFSSGLSTFDNSISGITNSIANLQNKINNEASSENRAQFEQTLIQQLGTILDSRQELQSRAASSFLGVDISGAKKGELRAGVLDATINTFLESFDGAGKKLLEAQAQIEGVTFDEVLAGFRILQRETLLVAETARKAAASLNELERAKNFMKDFSDSVDFANQSIKDLGPSLASVIAGANGSFATPGGSSNRSRVFGTAARGGFLQPGALDKALSSVTTGFGAGSSDIARFAKSEATLQRGLAGILENAVAKSGFNTENFSRTLREELGDTAGIDKKDINAIVNILEAKTASGGGTAVAQLRRDIVTDSSKVANDILGKTGGNFNATLERITAALAANEKSIASALNSRAQLELKIAQQTSGIAKKQFANLKALTELQDKRITIAQATTGLTNRQAPLTGDPAIALNPKAIGAELNKNLRRQSEIQKALRGEGDTDKRNKLNTEFSSLNKKIGGLRQALVNLTTATEETAAIQSELAKVQKDRELRGDIATEVAFGDKSSQLKFVRTIANIARVEAAGSINVLHDSQKADVASFLKRASDLQAPVFGKDATGKTRTGKELSQHLVRQQFRAGPGFVGTPDLEKALLNNGTFDPDKKEKDLINQFKEDGNRQVAASVALQAALIQQSSLSNNLITAALRENTNRIENAIISTDRDRVQGKIDSQKTARLGAQTKLDELERAFGAFVLSPSDENIRSVSAISEKVDLSNVDLEARRAGSARTTFTKGVEIRGGFQRTSEAGQEIIRDMQAFIRAGDDLQTAERKAVGKQLDKREARSGFELRKEQRSDALDVFSSSKVDARGPGITGKDIPIANLFKQIGGSGQKDILNENLFDKFSNLATQAFEQTTQSVAKDLSVSSVEARKDAIEALKSTFGEKNALTLTGGSKESIEARKSFIELTKAVKGTNFTALQNQVRDADVQLKILKDTLKKLNDLDAARKAKAPGSAIHPGVSVSKNSGGTIPGVGNTDTVPAMLTPGEFVINKGATRRNYGLLAAINSGKIQKFAKGGPVGKDEDEEDYISSLLRKSHRGKRRGRRLARTPAVFGMNKGGPVQKFATGGPVEEIEEIDEYGNINPAVMALRPGESSSDRNKRVGDIIKKQRDRFDSLGQPHSIVDQRLERAKARGITFEEQNAYEVARGGADVGKAYAQRKRLTYIEKNKTDEAKARSASRDTSVPGAGAARLRAAALAEERKKRKAEADRKAALSPPGPSPTTPPALSPVRSGLPASDIEAYLPTVSTPDRTGPRKRFTPAEIKKNRADKVLADKLAGASADRHAEIRATHNRRIARANGIRQSPAQLRKAKLERFAAKRQAANDVINKRLGLPLGTSKADRIAAVKAMRKAGFVPGGGTVGGGGTALTAVEKEERAQRVKERVEAARAAGFGGTSESRATARTQGTGYKIISVGPDGRQRTTYANTGKTFISKDIVPHSGPGPKRGDKGPPQSVADFQAIHAKEDADKKKTIETAKAKSDRNKARMSGISNGRFYLRQIARRGAAGLPIGQHNLHGINKAIANLEKAGESAMAAELRQMQARFSQGDTGTNQKGGGFGSAAFPGVEKRLNRHDTQDSLFAQASTFGNESYERGFLKKGRDNPMRAKVLDFITREGKVPKSASDRMLKNLGISQKDIDKARAAGIPAVRNKSVFQRRSAYPLRRNSGGGVPGTGNSDTVRALLTPGEFVLNKKATAAIGPRNLANFNNRFNKGGAVSSGGVQRFQNGGPVNATGGGSIALDGPSIAAISTFQQAASAFNNSMNTFSAASQILSPGFDLFGSSAETLSSALNAFNGELTLGGTFDVNVNINGGVSEAGVSQIASGVQAMIDSKVTSAIDNLSENLRDGQNPGTATNPYV